MSASNWAVCPACKEHRRARAAAAHQVAAEAYGTLPIEQFDRLRAEAEHAAARVEEDSDSTRTFREDYEFYGADTGTVHASYRGSCITCGLSLSFQHEHVLFPPAAPGRS